MNNDNNVRGSTGLLFVAGRSAQGRNVLRAWEEKSEAARYALMLRAEELPLGKPTELPMPVRAPSAPVQKQLGCCVFF